MEVWSKCITIFLKYIESSLLEDTLHNSWIVSNSAFSNLCQRSLHTITCHHFSSAISSFICIHQCYVSGKEHYCICICITQKPVILKLLATPQKNWLISLKKSLYQNIWNHHRDFKEIKGPVPEKVECWIGFNTLSRSNSHCFPGWLWLLTTIPLKPLGSSVLPLWLFYAG